MTTRGTELSDSPEATEALGARIAKGLIPGNVVLVSGELGAGKTTLVRGACRALGVSEPIASPTFTIGRSYRGRAAISHIDLYRLDDLTAEEPALLDDYLRPDSISFVEWPDVAGAIELVDGVTVALRVSLRHAGGDRREIELAPVD